jgi:hypothetical protein
MDLSNLANIGELLGGIGVIASLIYLAREIRGSTHAAHNTAYHESVNQILAGIHDMMGERWNELNGRGEKRWLNQLRVRCPGLRRHATLQFEMRSMRLCEMDGFKSVDPGFGDRSGNCSLGKFEPISPDQEQMLKDALRAQRDAKRKPPE